MSLPGATFSHISPPAATAPDAAKARAFLNLHVAPEPTPSDLCGILHKPLFDATVRAGAVDKGDAINKTVDALQQINAVWVSDSLEWSEFLAVLTCLGFPMPAALNNDEQPLFSTPPEFPHNAASLRPVTRSPAVALRDIAVYAHRSTRRLSELLFAMLYVRGRALTAAYRFRSLSQESEMSSQTAALKAEVERLKRKLIERSSKADDDRRRRVIAESYLNVMHEKTMNDRAAAAGHRRFEETQQWQDLSHCSADSGRSARCRPLSEAYPKEQSADQQTTGSKSFDLQRGPNTPNVDFATRNRLNAHSSQDMPIPELPSALPARRSIFRKSIDYDAIKAQQNQQGTNHRPGSSAVSQTARARERGIVARDPSFTVDHHHRTTPTPHLSTEALQALASDPSAATRTVTIPASSSGSDSTTHSSSAASDVHTEKSGGSSGASNDGRPGSKQQESRPQSAGRRFTLFPTRSTGDMRQRSATLSPTPVSSLTERLRSDSAEKFEKDGNGVRKRLSRMFSFGRGSRDKRSRSPPPPLPNKSDTRSADKENTTAKGSGTPDVRSRPVILLTAAKAVTGPVASASAQPAALPSILRHAYTAPSRMLRTEMERDSVARIEDTERGKCIEEQSSHNHHSKPKNSTSILTSGPASATIPPRSGSAADTRPPRVKPIKTSVDDVPLQVIRDKYFENRRRRTYHGQVSFALDPTYMDPHSYPNNQEQHQHRARRPKSRPSILGVSPVDHVRRHSWGPHRYCPPQQAALQYYPDLPHPHNQQQHQPQQQQHSVQMIAPTPLLASPGSSEYASHRHYPR
ncbi:hypothetical protein DFJ77DRAFT_38596 [Powellomyces hirtus]|nr:hypothetical protein DFJ77DRAFT_38596 [Powellomyces hirtus]